VGGGGGGVGGVMAGTGGGGGGGGDGSPDATYYMEPPRDNFLSEPHITFNLNSSTTSNNSLLGSSQLITRTQKHTEVVVGDINANMAKSRLDTK